MGKIKAEKRKVLVTGSSGMLGIDLCGELGGAFELSGIDVAKSPSQKDGVIFKTCDIRSRGDVENIISEIKPDIIIHTAAWTDVDGCEKDPAKAEDINILGTKNLADAAKKVNAFFIFISTDFVFDGKKGSLYKPEDAVWPLSVYGKTKSEAENAVKKLDAYAVLRTSWLYGRHGKNFVDTILNKAKTEKVIKVVNDQSGSPTYTKDLARAIKNFIETISHQPAPNPRHEMASGTGASAISKGIYHVSNKGVVTWFEYTKEILKISGIRGVEVLPITSRELNRPAMRPEFSGMDTSSFEKFTGAKLRTWQEALKEYLSERK